MRKIIYSGVLKFIAVILLIASITGGLIITMDAVFEYYNEDENIYSFEKDFSESWYIQSLLYTPERIVVNAYYNAIYSSKWQSGYETGNNTEDTSPDSEKVKDAVSKELTDVFGNEKNFTKINYYVKWNDLVFTNCGAASAEDLTKSSYFTYINSDGNDNFEYLSSLDEDMYAHEDIERFCGTNEVTISCSIDDDVAAKYKELWEKQKNIIVDTFFYDLSLALAALVLFIYLICVCGKNKNGEYKNMWLDNIWIEIHLAALIGAVLGTISLFIFISEEYSFGFLPLNMLYFVMGTVAALGSLIIITSLLSLIRNIKTQRLLKTSIILCIIKWCFCLLGKIAKGIFKTTKAFWKTIFRLLSKKTGVILISMLFVYTAIIGIFGIGIKASAFYLFAGILLFAFASFIVAYRAKDLDEIKKGVGEIRGGNVSYKIPETKCEDMKALSKDINDIAAGLDESLSAKLKAERHKSELITNVSHDLKTPITSIINYTELLSKMEDLPEEAKDYIAVIAKKSDRLKRLTEDLFDISKVQSGNDNVILEKLDTALLINQALGEHDNEIQSSGLVFCTTAPKDLYIYADGRKMSRVLSNLISNILKYTLKNTRVFITASEKDGMIEMEFKNISAYPLNFDEDEITARFVRGDESRSTEGNGLGLAIAKSYTELCGGAFTVATDGDMFKAIIKFKKYL